MSLAQEIGERAFDLGVPLSVHFDLTWRCNERCEHCYLPHDDRGEVTTAEALDILEQLAHAGVFFLALSGGEPMLRGDFWHILEHARRLTFHVKLKTNALRIGEREAARLAEIGINAVQVSVYSHRAEVHDGITKVAGSHARTMAAIRRMQDAGLNVTMANVLMRQNFADYAGVKRLAEEMSVPLTTDPTITPHIEGDEGLLDYRVRLGQLREVFRDPAMVGDPDEFCAPPRPAAGDELEGHPCSAAHTFCYVSPYADVFPCVQFPMPCGNLRRQSFAEIWSGSPQLNEVRGIRVRDLTTCSSCGHVANCSRCPGLAYMEGDMRGPSTADCEKSYARTGQMTANMMRKIAAAPGLVQIQVPIAR